MDRHDEVERERDPARDTWAEVLTFPLVVALVSGLAGLLTTDAAVLDGADLHLQRVVPGLAVVLVPVLAVAVTVLASVASVSRRRRATSRRFAEDVVALQEYGLETLNKAIDGTVSDREATSSGARQPLDRGAKE